MGRACYSAFCRDMAVYHTWNVFIDLIFGISNICKNWVIIVLFIGYYSDNKQVKWIFVVTTLHKSIEFYYITDGFSKEFGQEIKIYQVCSKETKRLSKSQVNSA
jgi:hypothetical protein